MDTDTAWDLWGVRDPYYGVLSHPKFRKDALTNQSREEFFASGKSDTEHVLSMCRRCAGADYVPRRVLDFGCGVGRMVIPFAGVADAVVGVDIAASMIAEAQRNCADRGLSNVSFTYSDDAISAVGGQFDLVHSSIVLQHISIVRGRALFAALVSRVAPFGCGVIHVTFGWDVYAESYGHPPPKPVLPKQSILSSLIAGLRGIFKKSIAPQADSSSAEFANQRDPEMQMNFYNLSELMFILHQAGVKGVHSEFTNHGGALGVYLVFQRARSE